MPQMLRLTFSDLRKVLIHFAVCVNFGLLAAGSSAWSRMSATTILQSVHSFATVLVNFAADAGLRDVGCVKWLASFQGEMTLAVGNVGEERLHRVLVGLLASAACRCPCRSSSSGRSARSRRACAGTRPAARRRRPAPPAR